MQEAALLYLDGTMVSCQSVEHACEVARELYPTIAFACPIDGEANMLGHYDLHGYVANVRMCTILA